MIDANLELKNWQYAATIRAFIRNRTPTTSNKGMVSPFEEMKGQKLNLLNLSLFGCKLQVHVPNTFQRKLDSKTKGFIFLGYMEEVKAGVFKHVATGQQFVLQDTIVKSMKLNSKLIVGPCLKYQSKNYIAKGSQEQPKDNRQDSETQGRMAEENSTPTPQVDELLEERKELPDMPPQQLLVRYVHELALTTQTKDEIEPFTGAEALESRHWQEAIKKQY